MKKKKGIIMGAAGRDFHNFNVYFDGNFDYDIIAFTAFQIPNISGRKYKGISIYPEEKITELIKKNGVSEVFFSYSDVSYSDLMKKAAAVLAAGANFILLGSEATMLKSKKPVLAVTAVRTGCGKSAVSQLVAGHFFSQGKRVGIIRHPMPYGDLEKQMCQKFVCTDDLKKHKCTIEEREEYEPYVENGFVVYAGVDYGKILEMASRENDLILWDGGNNDIPFYKSDLHIAIADARRPGHEVLYYPGEVNFRMADVIIIGKIDKDSKQNIGVIEENAKKLNPKAEVIKAEYTLTVDKPDLVRGKKVLVVEDGPSMTHGGLSSGVGYKAALKYKAGKIVDPRPFVSGSFKKIFEEYPHMDKILPAMGYSKRQMQELEEAINCVKCDSVILATPARLERFLNINKPFAVAKYNFKQIGGKPFSSILDNFGRRYFKG